MATPTISPLRQCMIEDMRMRKLADQSQTQCIRAVCQFAVFPGRSPDTASIKEPAALSTSSGRSRHLPRFRSMPRSPN
ncbi:hypothetical protein CBM2598_U10066 [Cupriavidus taiwanensis]|uniref:Uncharacterized protein n=1 Tax=Cupriavidus taiwanensis TaxID=164546 RepID=A0A7Z7NQ03_9BURK|nr:hypothetical protein CBM2597_U10283 [Cupriavidus taiwanensis]SOZ96245.1 hypothetical protein CBM2598_U10066 [Cupriavidus taiwanensis]SPC25788.1 hypothetical protein CBM2594_U10289 [Cupriavidus taiwanensis]